MQFNFIGLRSPERTQQNYTICTYFNFFSPSTDDVFAFPSIKTSSFFAIDSLDLRSLVPSTQKNLFQYVPFVSFNELRDFEICE